VLRDQRERAARSATTCCEISEHSRRALGRRPGCTARADRARRALAAIHSRDAGEGGAYLRRGGGERGAVHAEEGDAARRGEPLVAVAHVVVGAPAPARRAAAAVGGRRGGEGQAGGGEAMGAVHRREDAPRPAQPHQLRYRQHQRLPRPRRSP
jgi:hypothetical protein